MRIDERIGNKFSPFVLNYSYEDIKKINPRFDFTCNPSNTKYYKQMALKVDNF